MRTPRLRIIYVLLHKVDIRSTPLFISNRTLKNTDLSADGDGLAKQSCTGGNLWNLWNHGMYLCMNFKSCNFSLSIVLFIVY